MKVSKYVVLGLICLIIVSVASLGMAEKSESETINRAVIKIDTLSCGGCFSTISAGLSPLEGYSGMGANLFRKLIAVDFVAPLTKEQISAKLAEVGYPGTIEYVDPISEKESFAYLEKKRSGFTSGGGGCGSGGSSSCGLGGGYPAANSNNNGGSSPLLPSGGSCCSLPGAPPTEDL